MRRGRGVGSFILDGVCRAWTLLFKAGVRSTVQSWGEPWSFQCFSAFPFCCLLLVFEIFSTLHIEKNLNTYFSKRLLSKFFLKLNHVFCWKLDVYLFLSFFLSLLYFYPLLREQQSKTPMSHPGNVRRTRDKAGLYLLSKVWLLPAELRICVDEEQWTQSCACQLRGDHCSEAPRKGRQ